MLGTVWDESAVAWKLNSRSKKNKKKGFFNLFGGDRRNLILSNNYSSPIIKKSEYGVWKGKGGVHTVIDRGVLSTTEPLTTNSVKYNRDFSITQSWRCSPREIAVRNRNNPSKLNVTKTVSFKPQDRNSMWVDCDKSKYSPNILSIMGYSIRTRDFRYTAWYNYDWYKALPKLDEPLFEEEVKSVFFFLIFYLRFISNTNTNKKNCLIIADLTCNNLSDIESLSHLVILYYPFSYSNFLFFLQQLYDHRNEKLSDFTHREIDNLVYKNEFFPTVSLLKNQLTQFLRDEVVFRGPFS